MHSGIFFRLGFVIGILIIFLGCQNNKEEYTIGVVVGTEYFGAFEESFKEYMQVMGYTENENIQYDVHVGNLNKKEVAEIAEGFVKNNVDLIVTIPTGATSVAQATARNSAIPIVFGVAHTEGTGIINSVRKPGKNITGVRFPAEDLAVKRFEYLLSLVPDARTIMVPYRAGHPGITEYLDLLEKQATVSGKKLLLVALNSREDFESFIEDYPHNEEEPVDAILQLPDPVGSREDYFELYGQYAVNKDIVVGGDYIETDEIKSTFGVQVDLHSAARQVAFLVDKVLQGANAGNLSVLNPEPELTVNIKELRRLGIEAPSEMLNEADLVIR